MINILNNNLKFKEKYLTFHDNNINQILNLKERKDNFCKLSYTLKNFSKKNPTLFFKGLPYFTFFLKKGFSINKIENVLKMSSLSQKGFKYLNEFPKTNKSFLYPQANLKNESVLFLSHRTASNLTKKNDKRVKVISNLKLGSIKEVEIRRDNSAIPEKSNSLFFQSEKVEDNKAITDNVVQTLVGSCCDNSFREKNSDKFYSTTSKKDVLLIKKSGQLQTYSFKLNTENSRKFSTNSIYLDIKKKMPINPSNLPSLADEDEIKASHLNDLSKNKKKLIKTDSLLNFDNTWNSNFTINKKKLNSQNYTSDLNNDSNSSTTTNETKKYKNFKIPTNLPTKIARQNTLNLSSNTNNIFGDVLEPTKLKNPVLISRNENLNMNLTELKKLESSKGLSQPDISKWNKQRQEQFLLKKNKEQTTIEVEPSINSNLRKKHINLQSFSLLNRKNTSVQLNKKISHTQFSGYNPNYTNNQLKSKTTIPYQHSAIKLKPETNTDQNRRSVEFLGNLQKRKKQNTSLYSYSRKENLVRLSDEDNNRLDKTNLSIKQKRFEFEYNNKDKKFKNPNLFLSRFKGSIDWVENSKKGKKYLQKYDYYNNEDYSDFKFKSINSVNTNALNKTLNNKPDTRLSASYESIRNLNWSKKNFFFKSLSQYKLDTSDLTLLNNTNEIRKLINSKHIFNFFLSKSQSVKYCFNKNNLKREAVDLDSLYKYLKYYFSSLSALISKPIYINTSEKIYIQLFYFIMPNWAKLSKERKLRELISKTLKSDEDQKHKNLFSKIMTKFKIKEFLANWKESNNLVRLPNLPEITSIHIFEKEKLTQIKEKFKNLFYKYHNVNLLKDKELVSTNYNENNVINLHKELSSYQALPKLSLFSLDTIEERVIEKTLLRDFKRKYLKRLDKKKHYNNQTHILFNLKKRQLTDVDLLHLRANQLLQLILTDKQALSFKYLPELIKNESSSFLPTLTVKDRKFEVIQDNQNKFMKENENQYSSNFYNRFNSLDSNIIDKKDFELIRITENKSISNKETRENNSVTTLTSLISNLNMTGLSFFLYYLTHLNDNSFSLNIDFKSNFFVDDNFLRKGMVMNKNVVSPKLEDSNVAKIDKKGNGQVLSITHTPFEASHLKKKNNYMKDNEIVQNLISKIYEWNLNVLTTLQISEDVIKKNNSKSENVFGALDRNTDEELIYQYPFPFADYPLSYSLISHFIGKRDERVDKGRPLVNKSDMSLNSQIESTRELLPLQPSTSKILMLSNENIKDITKIESTDRENIIHEINSELITAMSKKSNGSASMLEKLAEQELFLTNRFNSLQLLKFRKTSTLFSLNNIISHKLIFSLETLFGKEVELDVKRIKYPYHDSNILSQLLKNSSNKTIFRNMVKKIFYTAIVKNPTNLIRKQDFSIIPSFLSGISVKLAGRINTQRVIPRFTVQSFQMGSLARGKVNYVETSRITHKGKRGAFTFTVTTSHITKNKERKR